MTREQIRRATQTRLKRSGLSMRSFAESLETNAGHLCQFLKHGTRPTPATLKALGYRRIDGEAYELDSRF